jgi:SAM-dependent methyltransferase
VTAAPVGRLGVSESLRRFVEELPAVRRPILELVRSGAAELSPGAAVLDVGAGDAPYRELFAHTDYRTLEWAESVHEAAHSADILASAEAIPVAAASFDAIVLTEVLEHVPDPPAVLAELARILRPGGRLFLTVPFAWPLHELPHDYFRYTDAGLRALLERAGFESVLIQASTDSFTTVAALLRNIGSVTGRDPSDGRDAAREKAAEVLAELADHVEALGPLDVDRVLPLGFAASATRSAA